MICALINKVCLVACEYGSEVCALVLTSHTLCAVAMCLWECENSHWYPFQIMRMWGGGYMPTPPSYIPTVKGGSRGILIIVMLIRSCDKGTRRSACILAGFQGENGIPISSPSFSFSFYSSPSVPCSCPLVYYLVTPRTWLSAPFWIQ